MLRTLHGQARRDAAIKWLTDAQQSCGYGQTIYVQNTLHRYLAGAVNQRIELLSWTLQAPTAIVREAVKQQRRL
tara:strand:- start:719 stop:940 length:222 start_codon:yes stop_codon:yes gene_type:complete